MMATVKLWTDAEAEAHPKVKAVFHDIRATRKSDFVNNFWRGLANQPEILERTWNTLKAVMGAPGPLDPLTRELIYIAVSITNGCSYFLRYSSFVNCLCEDLVFAPSCLPSSRGRSPIMRAPLTVLACRSWPC
jgi:alkylhydroperoxidase family enzyme